MVTYFVHHINKNKQDVILFTTFDVLQAMQFCSYNTRQSANIGLKDNYYFVGGVVALQAVFLERYY